MTSSVFFMRDADAGSPAPIEEDDDEAAFRQHQQQQIDYNKNEMMIRPAMVVGSRQLISPTSPNAAKLALSPSPAYNRNPQQQLSAASSPMLGQMQFVEWGKPEMGVVGGIQEERQVFGIPRYCYAPSDATPIP